MNIIQKIKYSLHGYFSQKCSKMIVKYRQDIEHWEKEKELYDIGKIQKVNKKPAVQKWFKFCSCCEYKLRKNKPLS
jgi:phosphoserine aminotransferase